MAYLRIVNDPSLMLHQDWCAEATKRGAYFTSHHNWFVSTAHTEADINKTLEDARVLLASDKNTSPAIRAMMEVLFLIITLMMNRFNLNSKNSSKPPSDDPNRDKKSKRNALGKYPGGQKGHIGKNLQPVESPDEITVISIDKRALPKRKYRDAGYDARQVIDIRISRFVIPC